MKPTIGNWYRIQGSDSFEVVAYDEDDGTKKTPEQLEIDAAATREAEQRAAREEHNGPTAG